MTAPSNLEAKDSQGWRRLVPGFGELGVTSWNGQTGDVKGTLANIYAFGVGDSPTLDNFFPMPEGDWLFPGVFQTTAFAAYGIGYIENSRVGGNANPWSYVRQFGSSTQSVARAFNAYSINDAAWNGFAPSLGSNPVWITEIVTFGHAADGDVFREQDAVFAQKLYQFATGGWTYPNPPGNGQVAYRELDLWNFIDGAATPITRTDGFGQTISIIRSNFHGITPMSTASQLFDHPGAAGDGTGWLASYSQGISFQNQAVKGGFTVATAADQGDPALDSWYSSIWAFEHGNDKTITEVLQAWADVGAKVLVGGLQLPSVDTGTFPVSDAGTARLGFDDTVKALRASIDGGAYATLLAAGSAGAGQVFLSVETDLTVGQTVSVVPAVAGKTFQPDRNSFLMVINTQTAGSVTAAGNLTAGTLGGNNLISAVGGTGFLSAAAFANGVNGYLAGGATSSSTGASNAACTVTIAAPPTGTGLTWKGRFLIRGAYV